MTCPFCGNTDIPAHARFCSHCGTAVRTTSASPTAAAALSDVDDGRDTLDELYDEKAAEFTRTDAAPEAGRSRHGFYAGQMSASSAPPARDGHADRTSPATTATASPAHFDERLGTGGRFASQPGEAPGPPVAHPPIPSPPQTAITPEMVFAFPAKVAPTTADAAPHRATAPTTGPEPDPIGRSLGAWSTPPAPAAAPHTAPEPSTRAPRPLAGSAQDLFPGTARASTTETPPSGAAIARASGTATAPSAGRDPVVPPTTGGQPPRVAASDLTATPSASAASAPDSNAPGRESIDAAPSIGSGAEGTRQGRWSDDSMHGGSCGNHRWHGPGPGVPSSWQAPASMGPAPATTQSRYWATGAHASAFVGAWLGGIPAFIGPLVVWLARKDSDPFAAEHGRNALNFNLSVIVYVIGMVLLSVVTFGIGLLVTIPGLIALAVAWFAFTLVGTIQAASSENYRYPLTIPFVR